MQKAKKGEFALHEDLKTDEDWQEIQEKKVGLRGHMVLSNPCFEIERKDEDIRIVEHPAL